MANPIDTITITAHLVGGFKQLTITREEARRLLDFAFKPNPQQGLGLARDEQLGVRAHFEAGQLVLSRGSIRSLLKWAEPQPGEVKPANVQEELNGLAANLQTPSGPYEARERELMVERDQLKVKLAECEHQCNEAWRQCDRLRRDLQEIAERCRVGNTYDEAEAKRRIIAIAAERDQLAQGMDSAIRLMASILYTLDPKVAPGPNVGVLFEQTRAALAAKTDELCKLQFDVAHLKAVYTQQVDYGFSLQKMISEANGLLHAEFPDESWAGIDRAVKVAIDRYRKAKEATASTQAALERSDKQVAELERELENTRGLAKKYQAIQTELEARNRCDRAFDDNLKRVMEERDDLKRQLKHAQDEQADLRALKSRVSDALSALDSAFPNRVWTSIDGAVKFVLSNYQAVKAEAEKAGGLSGERIDYALHMARVDELNRQIGDAPIDLRADHPAYGVIHGVLQSSKTLKGVINALIATIQGIMEGNASCMATSEAEKKALREQVELAWRVWLSFNDGARTGSIADAMQDAVDMIKRLRDDESDAADSANAEKSELLAQMARTNDHYSALQRRMNDLELELNGLQKIISDASDLVHTAFPNTVWNGIDDAVKMLIGMYRGAQAELEKSIKLPPLNADPEKP